MGQGLQRVAKQCGGIVVIAKGRRGKYDADGKIVSSRTAKAKQAPEALQVRPIVTLPLLNKYDDESQ